MILRRDSFPAVVPQRATTGSGRGDALELQKELDRVLLANYAPAAVLVSDDLEVLQSRGDTSPYLKLPGGKPSLNLLRMAREGLGFELRNAVAAAKQQKAPFRKEGIQIKSGDRTRNFRIEVTPLKLAFVNEPCFVVVFDEASPASSSAMQTAGPIAASQASETSEVEAARNQQLEQELANTKESLQSVIEKQEASNEELQAANEEISSANEELQSTNEELETSKEELQSTNEELNTVNDELRARNTELNQLSNDLANLLATVNIPIIMVDCNLRIRRLTPMAEKALRVIPADVGRLITDIKLNIDVPDLEKLILAVIESLQPVEQEVQDERGKWHSLQLRPYRTIDNRIDGVVLALQDIDVLKRSEQTFKQSSTFMRSVVETVREPLLVLDRGPAGNDGQQILLHRFPSLAGGNDSKKPLRFGKRTMEHPSLAHTHGGSFTQGPGRARFCGGTRVPPHRAQNHVAQCASDQHCRPARSTDPAGH